MNVDQEAVLDGLRELEYDEFENLVAELWESEGWETETTSAGPDEGVDVEAEDAGATSQSLAIQVKRYRQGNRVSEQDVRDTHAAAFDHRDFDSVAVVTTSDFTRGAYTYAYKNDIDLLAGEQVADLIIEHERFDLLDKYLESGFHTDFADQVSEEVAKVATRPNEKQPARPKTELRGYLPQLLFGSVLYPLGFVLLAIPSLEVISALILLFGMVGLPIYVGLDIKHLRDYDGNYQPSPWWPVGTFFSIGALALWYTGRRSVRTDLSEAMGQVWQSG